MESAFQAVSYGLTSTALFSEVGAVYMNFGIWGVSIIPAWMVLRHFGAQKEVVAENSGSSGMLSSETDSSSEKQVGRKEGSDDMAGVKHVH